MISDEFMFEDCPGAYKILKSKTSEKQQQQQQRLNVKHTNNQALEHFNKTVRHESESRGIKLDDPNRIGSLTNNLGQILPPVDRYNLIYYGLVLSGVGFLLPYNSFIMAVDYFKSRYPGTTVIFDMSTIYITTAFVAVLVNNLLVETLSLHTRIKFGYLISISTLLFVAFGEIWWNTFGLSSDTSYTINLFVVAVVAFGCTVQQSSFYGYTSMLPSVYTQAVMAGESAAGFWTSMNRVFTKALFGNDHGSTLIFFFLSSIIILGCFYIHMITGKSDFVAYYLTLCQDSKTKIVLEPTEDQSLMEILENGDDITGKNHFGFLKLQTPDNMAQTSLSVGKTSTYSGDGRSGGGYSFANPLYDPNSKKSTLVDISINDDDGAVATTPDGSIDYLSDGGGGTKFKVEDIITTIPPNSTASFHGIRCNGQNLWNDIKRGWWDRWKVTKLIWIDMVAIGWAYFVTLTIYPGVISEVKSCRFGSWLPVILMSLFNGFDLVGKIMAQWIHMHKNIIFLNILRTIFFYYTVILCLPRSKQAGILEINAMIVACTLGLSNGIFGSIPMINAPSRVPEHFRELAGNLMTLSYNLGLVAGSFSAYYVHNSIKLSQDLLCNKFYPNPTSTATTLTVTNSTTPIIAWATTIANCCLTTMANQTTSIHTTESLITVTAPIVSANLNATTTEFTGLINIINSSIMNFINNNNTVSSTSIHTSPTNLFNFTASPNLD